MIKHDSKLFRDSDNGENIVCKILRGDFRRQFHMIVLKMFTQWGFFRVSI